MLKNSGLQHERETVISFTEGDPTAHVRTASRAFFYKLVSHGYAPSFISVDERSAEFILPKKAVSIRRPRRQKETP